MGVRVGIYTGDRVDVYRAVCRDDRTAIKLYGRSYGQ
jgi:hypothetical protein